MRRAIPTWMLCALILAPLSSIACSWGDPSRRLQDEIRGYYNADVVFLARIRTLEERPPAGSQRFWTAVATYDLLETYRGVPARNGVLASEMSFKPGVDGVPPNSCIGGALPAGSEGARMLVFASRLDQASPTAHYRIDRFNSLRIDNCVGCNDVLERMRLYSKAEHVPLTQN
ncbi:hypothetical protein [Luteimonas deserti]|uniref:Lipoprotein n=1 Tax=Luteimonas deserti TaxID=2752306 RepID=A0A7Z0QTI1_9GAMM|nr:hypothetical protein [Luteimonas deserti]NYZ63779.1 hypothetical protein [Luteimonas deserti]